LTKRDKKNDEKSDGKFALKKYESALSTFMEAKKFITIKAHANLSVSLLLILLLWLQAKHKNKIKSRK
jgi:hypothetical protein